LIEKLTAAGVTSVEALADMTPEQLEAIEGIGPKTVEKISVAVSDFFSSLEAAATEAEPAAEGEPAPQAAEVQEAGTEAVEDPVTEAVPSEAVAGSASETEAANVSEETEVSAEEGASSEGKE